MMYGEVYVGERTMQGRLQDRLDAHESRRLVHLARSRTHRGMALHARRLVGPVSHLLMVVGARLVDRALPPYSPVKRELMENGSYRA
jgi:hypothetical protein